eukprot:1316560-Amorphochlora_amoeboformis.AAC.1
MEARYYRILLSTTRNYLQGNLRAISGISGDGKYPVVPGNLRAISGITDDLWYTYHTGLWNCIDIYSSSRIYLCYLYSCFNNV